MKILVISLLRLGDFLQTVPVIAGLARKFPGARIDLLTHTSVRSFQPLLPNVGVWWSLNRDELQAGLGRRDIPLLTSFDVLKEKMDQISHEDYDLVINLTHTRFSGYLNGYIQAKEKLGLTLTETEQVLFLSPWFRYLDQHAQIRGQDIFNYTDIFYGACALDSFQKEWPLTPTHNGRSEVEKLCLSHKPMVVCQPFTSDPKKNWSESSWVQMISRLKADLPEFQIVLLGAPSEEEAVERIREKCGNVPTKAIVSLDGALALLQRGQLLITGDTSIKHLANAAPNIRVLELSLGSSDYLRTGIYKAGSLILQPKLPCSPCAHTEPCSQQSHLCAQGLEPQLVARCAQLLLKEDWTEIKKAACAHSQVAFLRTHHLDTKFWFPVDLTGLAAMQSVDRILDRCAFKFLFNQSYKAPLAEFGTESVRIQNEVGRLFPKEMSGLLLAHLDFLDRELTNQQTQTPRFDHKACGREAKGDLIQLHPIRETQNENTQRLLKSEIKIKLVRSLKSRLMESI